MDGLWQDIHSDGGADGAVHGDRGDAGRVRRGGDCAGGGGGMNLFGYWNADKAVLRMTGAREVDETERAGFRAAGASAGGWGRDAAPQGLCDRDRPAQCLCHRAQPAECGGGGDDGVAAAVEPQEVAAVMAHELAHIQNRDTLIMTVTATFAGAIGMLANFALFFGATGRPGGVIGTIALMILAPLAAGLVQMAISRSREYEADRVGADLRQSLVAGLGLAEDRGLCQGDRQQRRPSATRRWRICSSSTRCMPMRDRCFPPTRHREPDCRAGGDGGGGQALGQGGGGGAGAVGRRVDGAAAFCECSRP
jgi:hypothetical protein